LILSHHPARVIARRLRAQQPAMPVIGFLNPQSADDSKNFNVAVLQGLKETGYVEGRNVAVEYRYAQNQLDQLPALAADLVRRRVAVIVVSGDAALAAKAATTTIPIVFNTGADPVALGLVASLNRPGGNITGIAGLAAELAPKQLQLLRELIPNAARFGVLVDSAFSSTPSLIAGLQAAARTLGMQLLLRMQEPIAISKRPSQLFRNSASVRSSSAPAAFTTGAWNNLRRSRPAIRCPQCSHIVSTLWPAA
jgi:ABC-type uncharacterized transport system substrate-binding protein